MATGRLGTADLAADSEEIIYTCPQDTFTVASVSFCNRGNNGVAVRLAIASGTEAEPDEFLEFDVEILGKGVLERTGIIVGAGQNLIARASAPNVSVVAFGIETSTV